MKTQIRTWGNSRAVRLPAKSIKESGLSEDDELEVLVEDGDIILTKRADREVESVKRALLYKDGFCGLSDIVIESDVRKEAEEVCKEIGLSLQVAIGVFLRKISKERRIPFELNVGDETDERRTSGGRRHKTLEERIAAHGGELRVMPNYDWGEPKGREMW